MNFEEICKQKIINSSLFKSNSANLYDPNFDYNGFLCDLVKLIDIPGLDPILNKDERTPYYTPSQDFSLLSTVGDPRMSLGLTLSAGFINFLPSNLVRIEAQTSLGTQIIEGVICDKDGKPVKTQMSNSFENKTTEEKEIFVRAILDDPDFKNVYPQYDFYQTICIDEQPALKIAQLEISIDSITALSQVRPNTQTYNELFSYSYEIDLPKCPLDFDNIINKKFLAEDYKGFTFKLMDFGKVQHAMYFCAFIYKFFPDWNISLHEKVVPPMFHIELQKNDKVIFLKYWPDDVARVMKLLDISKVTKDINSPVDKIVFKTELARTIVDAIPDYRRIMQSAKYQVLFYSYVLGHYQYKIPTITVTASGGKTIIDLEARVKLLEAKK